MIRLQIKNSTVDLPKNTALSLEYNSPLWTGGDIDFIPGTVVFNFTALATAHNRSIFNFVDAQDSRLTIRTYTGILFWKGAPLIVGTVTVQEIISGQFKIKIQAATGALSEFKTMYLDELTTAFNKTFTFTGTTEMDAATDGDEDYLFVPFLLEDDTVVNEWNIVDQTFKSAPAHVPFLKVVFLIEHLLESAGWTLDWNEKENFRDVLFLMTNRDEEDNNFSIISCAPHITVTELIKATAKITGCAIIADGQRRRLTFVPYSYIQDAAVVDWTDRKVGDSTQEFTTATLSDADFSAYRQTDDSYLQSDSQVSPPAVITSTLDVPKVDFTIRTGTTDNIEKAYFVFYRGLEEGSEAGYDYPYASAQSVAGHKFALTYDDSEGIKPRYEDYLNKIANTRTITMPLKLQFLDLQKLNFTSKVRIFNQKEGTKNTYLVKQVKVTLTNKLIQTATVEMLKI